MEPQLLSVRGTSPQLGADCWLAPTATLVGDVVLGDRCTVWFNALVRGDVNRIRIGQDCNIQDGAILHCTYQTAETVIGNRVSIGHAAVVHGCTVHDDVLIGIGAKLLDHSVVEPNVLVAAGALVRPGQVLESGFLYGGLPAKKLRPLKAEEAVLIRRTAENYRLYAGWYKNPEKSGAS